MKKLLHKKGFTLIEMLIVVAIIAILATIAIPSFNGAVDEAKSAADQTNVRAAKVAAIIYDMDTDIIDAGVWYDAETGAISTTQPSAYGQMEEGTAIKITETSEGVYEVDWVAVTP